MTDPDWDSAGGPLRNGDRVLIIPLDVKATVILTRLDGTIAVVADNATQTTVWDPGEIQPLPDDDPIGELIAPWRKAP